MSLQITSCLIFVLLIFGSAFGQQPAPKIKKPDKKVKEVKPKPLKPLTEKEIRKANKKASEANSAKSIQKANEKILKKQAKAIREANRKGAKANKALLKAHAKVIRDAEKQTKEEAKRKKLPSNQEGSINAPNAP